MASVNKAILIGNLGKDPELKYTPGGAAVCNFSIATKEKWLDKTSNEWKESTTWHNIVLWGKQAENANQYLHKGSPVYIEGRIQNRSYDDNSGNKRYISEVVGQRMQFLSNRGEGDGAEKAKAPPPNSTPPPPLSGEDDDLPF